MQSSQDEKNLSKIYVGNLPYSVTEDQLREMCQEFGEITYCKVITHPHTGRSKGFGFVEFASPEAAQAAIDALNGSTVEERELVVNIARPRTPRTYNNRSGGGYNRGGYNQGGYDRNN